MVAWVQRKAVILSSKTLVPQQKQTHLGAMPRWLADLDAAQRGIHCWIANRYVGCANRKIARDEANI